MKAIVMKPKLLKQAVEEFRQIYLEEYGIELSHKEASYKALSMLQLFQVLTDKYEEVLS